MTFTDGSCQGRSRSEEEVMLTTSHRRCFASSTPSRSPQWSWNSWDETLNRCNNIHFKKVYNLVV